MMHSVNPTSTINAQVEVVTNVTMSRLDHSADLRATTASNHTTPSYMQRSTAFNAGASASCRSFVKADIC
eukprot:2932994-Amphidinium_carterae.2